MRKPRRRQRGGKKTLTVLVGITALILLSLGAYIFYGQRSTTGVASTITGINTGNKAPYIPVSLTNGSTISLGAVRGHAVLLWFVTTWCTSCQQGAQLMASQYYSQLHSEGVTVLTVESYNDLGYSGPSISQFADQYAGGSDSPGWLFATTTQSATYTYNPQAYLDIYYLVDSSGVIVTSGVGLPAALPSIVSTAGSLQSTGTQP